LRSIAPRNGSDCNPIPVSIDAAVKRALLLLFISAGAAAEPRPINGAEREAVAVVAAYLAEGPRALWTQLTPDAPLRALPEQEALQELSVRTGPRDGARWSLQTIENSDRDVAFKVTFPSGYEDGLLFRMQRGKVREVLTMAEDGRRPNESRRPRRPPLHRNALIAAAVVSALLAAFIRRLRVPLALLAAVGAGLAVWNPQFERPETQLPFVELRVLEPLRTALARGDEPRIPKEAKGEARAVAQLWILQSGSPGDLPHATSQLAALVTARVALVQDKEEEARQAFDRALAIRRRDDVALEAVTSLEVFRDDFAGSREAALYYARAIQAAADGNAEEAQKELRTAWRLRPRPREELVRDTHLFPLLHDVRAMSMVSLLGAQEPLQRSAVLATNTVPLPPDAQTFVCGEFLRVQLPKASLDVPGGAALAPPNATLVPATHWKRQEDAAALRDAQSLLEVPAQASTPAARSRLLRAASALAAHNRWPDLLKLTDDITPQTESVPPDLLVLRMRALLRAGRVDDARALAAGDAVKAITERSDFPSTLISVADAMANINQYDAAAPLYQAVKSKEHEPLVAARIRQLELRRTLAQNGVVIQTAHFDIRHDPKMNPAIASRIGDLLEAELARLEKTLGAAAPRRVTVNVLYWDDFRTGITNSDHILGLYDGEILFPFAVVQQFKPEVVAIITHELTHALVAQATGDNAPRWFQEGIAQRMELRTQANAFNNRNPQLVLPVPLLDAVMENAIDQYTLEHGYSVAHTFIRFLESSFGENALATLMAEFAKGRNTDDALQTLTGKTPDELNREFRQWGFANTANFASAEAWPYGHLYSPGIDPRVREGFSWGKRR
jgi:tetratricopeptide (TPR) repeat protein